MSSKQTSSRRDLVLLMAVPLTLMTILAAIVYLPRLLAHPSHDFIYTTCESYDCYNTIRVQDGAIVVSNSNPNKTPVTLRYYDVSEQAYRTLTPAEAQQYTLDSSSRSPDGYALEERSSSSGFLFWSDVESDQWFLENGLYKKPVHFGGTGYYNDITLVGWVK